MKTFKQTSKAYGSFDFVVRSVVCRLQFFDFLSIKPLIFEITENYVYYNLCMHIDFYQKFNTNIVPKDISTYNQILSNIQYSFYCIILHYIINFIIYNYYYFGNKYHIIGITNFDKITDNNIHKESNDNNNNSENNSSNNTESNNNSSIDTNNNNSSNDNNFRSNNNSNNTNNNNNTKTSNNGSDDNSNNNSGDNNDNNNNNNNNPNHNNKNDYDNKKKSNNSSKDDEIAKESDDEEEKFIDSKSRKSSVAIFVPSIMMSRMSDELVKSSQEKLYPSRSTIDENLFSDHYLNSTKETTPKESKIISESNKPIQTSIINQQTENIKDNDSNDCLNEYEDEFDKLFKTEINDKPIELEECQNVDEKGMENMKETSIFDKKDDLTLLFNNETIGDIHSLIDPKNAFIVDEGPFTMDCIKVSETMNDALEIITSRRKEDLEPFSLKIKETTSFYREKIECSQKQSKVMMKSRLESIKNSHNSSLKAFKEKESIIHYRLIEIDSSVAKISTKLEEVQSFLRSEIRKNKIFLEKKINELRKSLKYAC